MKRFFRVRYEVFDSLETAKDYAALRKCREHEILEISEHEFCELANAQIQDAEAGRRYEAYNPEWERRHCWNDWPAK